MNRESYLNYITNTYARPHFAKAGYTIPANIRMSCSLTSRKKHIGECWSSDASQDQHFEIFISPKVADSVEVIDILIHELCHATVGNKAGHGAIFKKCALAVGLEGKMTSASASPELKAIIQSWVDQAGQYPHAPLTQSNIKKQSTRLLKCVCGECGYTVRLAKKWLDVATPECPNPDCFNHGYPMQTEQTEETEE